MAKEQLNKGPLRKLKSRNPKIEFDQLQMFFREPYVIDLDGAEGSITMTQPSIGDVVMIGAKKFYSTLNVFTCNTTTFRLQLWDAGQDWNVLSDFELFKMLIGNADREVYQTFLPEIDFANFHEYDKKYPDSEQIVKILYDSTNKIEINEQVYFHISQYLRTVFNVFPEEKLTKDKLLKKAFIEKDRRELRNMELKDEKPSSGLFPLISACCNHPGFKYKSSELKQLGVYEFYDSVKRLQVYESTTAIQKGLYSGMMDGSKIKFEDYNFMKEI